MLKFSCALIQPSLRSSGASVCRVQIAGIKCYTPKPPLDTSDWPENRKLPVLEKQPNFGNYRAPRMPKMIRLMRGPELVQNQLLYKGYGVKALLGGRLRFEHFEFIRNYVNRKLNTDRMFAIWRVEAPWQPVGRRGIGKRMGGGKGAIDHYVTPVKADRFVVELCGDVPYIEARHILVPVANSLPFLARFYSQRDLEKEMENDEWVRKNNKNLYSMEYMIMNNIGGCQSFLSPNDSKWFGRYR